MGKNGSNMIKATTRLKSVEPLLDITSGTHPHGTYACSDPRELLGARELPLPHRPARILQLFDSKRLGVHSQLKKSFSDEAAILGRNRKKEKQLTSVFGDRA
jgi:hypothetical protein